ncbi:MAG: STAS domain-containing protein [Acidiferrobacterales bacterium]
MNQSLVKATRQEDKTRISLGPVLDVAGSGELKKQLEKIFRRKRPFELDGSAVERVDTAALQVLVAFSRESHNREIDLRWAEVSDALRTASTMLGLNQELGINN